MRTINTKQALLALDGTKLIDESTKGEVLIGRTIANVLSGKTHNPTMAYLLAKRFTKEQHIALKAEEISFIKMEINQVCGPNGWMTSILGGQILAILDGTDTGEVKMTSLSDTEVKGEITQKNKKARK